MNIFKKLFGSQTTSKETKQEENKNFDVLKYDGVRALRMQSLSMLQNALYTPLN